MEKNISNLSTRNSFVNLTSLGAALIMIATIIGAGSTYTPTIVQGWVDHDVLSSLDSITMVDTDPQRLQNVYGFVGKDLEQSFEENIEINTTTDLKEGLKGSDFVIMLASAGGLKSRQRDEYLCRRHRVIAQETVGVGGFISALRNIDVLKRTIDLMNEKCPNAWLIILSNPTGILTEAAMLYGQEKTIGLCEISWRIRSVCAKMLNADIGTIQLDYVGLNHFSWVRNVFQNGVDVTASIFERLDELLAKIVKPNLPNFFDRDFIRNLGMIPSPYLQFYYAKDTILADQLKNGRETSRAVRCREIDKLLHAAYRDLDFGKARNLIAKRGGTTDIGQALGVLMRSLLSEKPMYNVIITRNVGSIPTLLDDNEVIETMLPVSKEGIASVKKNPLDPCIHRQMHRMKAYERLVAETALESNYSKARKALSTNPLVPSPRVARELLNDILNTFDYRGRFISQAA